MCLAWSETPEDTFSHGVAHIIVIIIGYYECFSKRTKLLEYLLPHAQYDQALTVVEHSSLHFWSGTPISDRAR